MSERTKRRLSMRNLYKLLGIIAIGAVIGFALMGCKQDVDDDSGGGGDLWAQLFREREYGCLMPVGITHPLHLKTLKKAISTMKSAMRMAAK
jgi:hypothetical protein